MAEPTAADYQESDFTDVYTTDELTASVTWGAGDIILVFGAISNNESSTVLGLPTVTGLTFAELASLNENTDARDDTVVYLWSATAGSSGSGQIASVTSGGISTLRSGLAVLVYSGSDGLGTPVTMDGGTGKTISVTRAGDNSHVALIMADWNQVGDVTVDATPTGTVRKATALSGQMDVFVCSFGDQGSAGTTSYGITNHTGTVDMSGIAIEIKGTAGAPAEAIRILFAMPMAGTGGGRHGGSRVH